jgi:hypothetical protein
VSYFHCVKWGILGVRTVHGFGSDWGDLEEFRLIGESPQRGSAQETLGEPSNFKLWHLGHNTRLAGVCQRTKAFKCWVFVAVPGEGSLIVKW